MNNNDNKRSRDSLENDNEINDNNNQLENSNNKDNDQVNNNKRSRDIYRLENDNEINDNNIDRDNDSNTLETSRTAVEITATTDSTSTEITISTSTSNKDLENKELLTEIFNTVFKIKYLKRIIFYHLNLFNIFLPVNFTFQSFKEWQEYKYKEYLNRVTLDFEDGQFNLDQLPMNIKHITIRPPFKDLDESYGVIQLPDHIESVSYTSQVFVHYFNIQQPQQSKIKTLRVYSNIPRDRIVPLPSSITNLEIDFKKCSDDSPLSNNVLPSNVKKLLIRGLKLAQEKSLEIESLTDITLNQCHPLIVQQLSTARNLVKLHFLNILAKIDSSIRFPDTLEELMVQCKIFDAILPANLKKLELFIKSFPKIELPSSLQHLALGYHEEFENPHQFPLLLPSNLKSLQLSTCSSIVYDNGKSILPEKLEKLVIWGQFNQVLQVNQLPSTLTHLNLGSLLYNQVIDINVLPANLETLILGPCYSQAINPLAIPQHLKLLQIANSDYSHPINLTPSTHPNTAISCESIELYYQATSPDYNQIRVLRLPDRFNSPLSTLQLKNKSNLEYLHLGEYSNPNIELLDLPLENNIKTLVLNNLFNQVINLEHFKKLETIILQKSSNPLIVTVTAMDEEENVYYNNYKLKNIIVSPLNTRFLKQLDINFYKFLKYTQ